MIVQDTNDNEPKFEKEFYEIDVDESLPKDSQIVPLNARDLDKGKNGRLTYTIIDRDPGVEDYIGVLPSSGIMFLKKQLDREEITSLSMTVRVQDQGLPQLSDTARVKLNIVDVNDNKPVFTAASYSFSVVENIAADSVIGVVTARDGDTGRNGEILYSIKSDSGKFRIDNPSGRTRNTSLSTKNSPQVIVQHWDQRNLACRGPGH